MLIGPDGKFCRGQKFFWFVEDDNFDSDENSVSISIKYLVFVVNDQYNFQK